VFFASRNALSLKVVLKIRQLEAILRTNTVGSQLPSVDQPPYRDDVNS
jgi:hypothetical protein